jgi:hypothetical protein
MADGCHPARYQSFQSPASGFVPPVAANGIMMPTFCPNLICNSLHYLALGIFDEKASNKSSWTFCSRSHSTVHHRSSDYFNVTDYQERFDRLRARLKHFAVLQLSLPFSMPQQAEPDDSDDPNPAIPNE